MMKREPAADGSFRDRSSSMTQAVPCDYCRERATSVCCFEP